VLGRIASVLCAHPPRGGAAAPGVAPADLSRTAGAPDAKLRILGAMFRLVAFALERAPIVILCDDIQWADDASLDLIDDLVARAESLPLCVVCAARPEQDERRRPSRGEPIDVLPLARRHVEEMIRDRLRRVRGLDPELVRLLADRAEGNPRTLEESLQLLVDAGVIDTTGEAWSVREAELGALSLPATGQGLVQARLDRLDPEARSVVALASVIGRTFWEGAVERLRQAAPQTRSPRSNDPSVQLDDLDPPFSVAPGEVAAAAPPREDGAPTTAALLSLLCDRQLIRPRTPSTIAGDREYVFAEGSTCEVAYEMLSLKVRRRIHLLVADWLEKAPGAAGAALLALHYDRGGDLRDAAAAYARAAAHAASVGEVAEARRLLSRVRDLHDEASDSDDARPGSAPGSTPPPAERQSALPRPPLGGTQRSPSWEGADRRVAPWRERVRVRLELGDLLRQAGDVDGAARAYEEGRARILREERRFGPAIDPMERLRWEARVDFRAALVLADRGFTREALALARRALAQASEGGAEGEIESMKALVDYLEAGGEARAP
ncbi:MAG: AAA family ATPase, partial [Polyangiaceae bacterium]|nr:AAA family ATPase [Polyangiaceae bacterium]